MAMIDNMSAELSPIEILPRIPALFTKLEVAFTVSVFADEAPMEVFPVIPRLVPIWRFAWIVEVPVVVAIWRSPWERI